MRLALTMRVVEARGYREPRDAISHDWVDLCEEAGLDLALLPNARGSFAQRLADATPDLLVLTGGDDVRHAPSAPSSSDPGDPYRRRDIAEAGYIAAAIERHLPILGVCRGLQLLNLYFGGSVHAADQPEQHRATEHTIHFRSSPLAAPWDGKPLLVNSYHTLTIPAGALAHPLAPLAVAQDGTIEAAFHQELPILGVMWHPERPMTDARAAAVHRSPQLWETLTAMLRGSPTA